MGPNVMVKNMWEPLEDAIDRVGSTFDLLLLTAIVLVIIKTGSDVGLLQGISKVFEQFNQILSSTTTQINILLVVGLTILYLIKDMITGLVKMAAKVFVVLILILVTIQLFIGINVGEYFGGVIGVLQF